MSHSREIPVGIVGLYRKAAGSYSYVCSVAGGVMFTHQPIGTVLYVLPRKE